MSDTRIKITGDSSDAVRAIGKLNNSLDSFRSKAASISASMAKVFVPVAAIGAALGGLGLASVAGNLFKLGGDFDDLSSITGESVKDLVVLSKAFELAGLSTEDVQKALGLFGAKMGGTGAEVDKLLKPLNAYGVTAKNIEGLSLSEQFQKVGAAIAAIPDVNERLNLSKGIFGKQGVQLNVLFNDPEIFTDAKTILGGLPAIIDDSAKAWAGIDDAVGSATVKVQQFVAGVLSANTQDLVAAAEAFKALDLTQAGQALGKSLSETIEVFKLAWQNGNVFEKIGDGLMAGIKKAGEFLLSVFELAAQRFGRAIENSLKGTAIGSFLLRIKADEHREIVRPDGSKLEYTIVHNQTATPEAFGEILKRNQNLLGSEDSKAAFQSEIKAPAYVASKAAANVSALEDKRVRDLFKEAEMQMYRTQKSADDWKTGLTIQKAPEGLEAAQKAFNSPLKAVANQFLDSMAKVGGRASITGQMASVAVNPQVELQRTANSTLSKIEQGIQKLINKETGGLTWQ